MQSHTLAAIRRGVEAAVLAGIPQVIVPKIQEKLILGEWESADLGPHFIEALADHASQPLPEDVKWLSASAFHFGYAAFWGTVYALAYEKRPVEPWLGGLALAGTLYLITFPPWGVAVLSGTEDRPRDRSWPMELVLASAPLVFGLGTALLYWRGPGHTVRDRIESWWRTATSS